jgi:hypothetical protein
MKLFNSFCCSDVPCLKSCSLNAIGNQGAPTLSAAACDGKIPYFVMRSRIKPINKEPVFIIGRVKYFFVTRSAVTCSASTFSSSGDSYAHRLIPSPGEIKSLKHQSLTFSGAGVRRNKSNIIDKPRSNMRSASSNTAILCAGIDLLLRC